MKRLIPSDYHALAEARGFNWLGPEVSNVGTRTIWECIDAGHQWETTYQRIKSGSKCPYCAGRARKTMSDYRTVAIKRGIDWVGVSMPSSVLHKTNWQCRKGHQWEAAYNDIHRGRGCPTCSRIRRRKTLSDYHLLAKQRGFKWIDKELPLNNKTKTWWQCELGHEWQAGYSSISHGNGCPGCKADNLRLKPDDYYQLAEERGYKWLGPEVDGSRSRTEWECENGHRWFTGYDTLSQSVNGCPYCAGNLPKTKKDYHALAAERGYIWLGPHPNNGKSKTEWGCANGHRWFTGYDTLSQSVNGCPHCADMVNGVPVSQPQRDLCNMVNGRLNYPFRNYSIDVAILLGDIKISIEYDGWYWHKDSLERDKTRDAEMLSAGWKILRVKSGSKLPSHAQLFGQIANLIHGQTYAEIILDDWGE